jgi:cytochrome P450
LLEFARNNLHFIMKMARDYGPLSYCKLGFDHTILLNHPDYFHEVLVTQQRNFHLSVTMTESKRVLGDVLLTMEGEAHRHERRLMQQAFLHERVHSYGAEIVGHATRVRDRWREGPLEIEHEMMLLTLGTASKALLGVDMEDQADEFSQAFSEAAWYTVLMAMIPHGGVLDHLPLPGTHHFHQARDRLYAIVSDVIALRRRTGEDRGDLLSLLVHARKSGDIKDDEQLRNEVLATLIAGHETTATTLTWTWYLLSQHPEVEAELHRELDTVLEGRPPTIDDLPRLRFTEMVVAEALRLYPPIYTFSRLAQHAFTLGGYHLPARTQVLISPYVIHRDPANYPDPERFDPRRMEPEARAARSRYAYVPFGAGSRQCLGEPFAWAETTLVLATLATHWRLRLGAGHTVVPEPLMTLRPKGGMPMVLERRANGPR